MKVVWNGNALSPLGCSGCDGEEDVRTVEIHDLLVNAERIGRHTLVLAVVRVVDVVDSQTPARQHSHQTSVQLSTYAERVLQHNVGQKNAVNKKSKLLIISKSVNKTEKIGRM